MNDFWQQLRDQVQRVWEQLNTQQRVLFVSAPVMLLVTLGIAVYLAGKPQLENLITADREVIAQIEAYLVEQGIEHTVVSERQIKVDESIKATTMLALARENLIGAQMGKGYEIFDEFSFGMTDDLFQLNSNRALQGKLESMIVAGDKSVKSAKVVLAIPEETIFKEDTVPPTAVVKLVTSGQPTEGIVVGIQNLVSAAVPRMKPENVTVTGNNNTLLSEEAGTETGVKLANKRMEIRLQEERIIVGKLSKKLDELVGEPNYTVTVNVRMDWEKESIKNVNIDSEAPATVSQKNYNETTKSQGITGPPGVVSNTQDDGIGAEGESSETTIEETIINNRHPWTETLIERETGEITDITVDVLVNYHYDENDELVPWPQEKLDEWRVRLANTAGLTLFPQTAQDPNVHFTIGCDLFDDTTERALARERMIATATSIVQSMIPLILLFALGYFAYVFFQRAFAPPEVMEEEITDEIPIEPVSEAKELTLSQLGLAEFGDIASLPAEEQRRIKMQEHVINYAAEKPEEVATIIKSWLSQ